MDLKLDIDNRLEMDLRLAGVTTYEALILLLCLIGGSLYSSCNDKNTIFIYKYRITSVLKVETDIITSNTVSPMVRTV